jgi:hypothetical protein
VIDQRVPDGARVIITRIAGRQDLTAQFGPKRVEHAFREHSGAACVSGYSQFHHDLPWGASLPLTI